MRARLLRAREVTDVWGPGPLPEAIRDLVRARHTASGTVRAARVVIRMCLLKHNGRVQAGKAPWTKTVESESTGVDPTPRLCAKVRQRQRRGLFSERGRLVSAIIRARLKI